MWMYWTIVRMCSHRASRGACHWSCLLLWSGSGTDSLSPPPLISCITRNFRRKSNRLKSSRNPWMSYQREGQSRAMSSTFTSSHVRVCPTWAYVPARSLLPRPSAFWRTCAGNSQHALTTLQWPWQTGRTHFWSLIVPFKNFSSIITRKGVRLWRWPWLKCRKTSEAAPLRFSPWRTWFSAMELLMDMWSKQLHQARVRDWSQSLHRESSHWFLTSCVLRSTLFVVFILSNTPSRMIMMVCGMWWHFLWHFSAAFASVICTCSTPARRGWNPSLSWLSSSYAMLFSSAQGTSGSWSSTCPWPVSPHCSPYTANCRTETRTVEYEDFSQLWVRIKHIRWDWRPHSSHKLTFDFPLTFDFCFNLMVSLLCITWMVSAIAFFGRGLQLHYCISESFT